MDLGILLYGTQEFFFFILFLYTISEIRTCSISTWTIFHLIFFSRIFERNITLAVYLVDVQNSALGSYNHALHLTCRSIVTAIACRYHRTLYRELNTIILFIRKYFFFSIFKFNTSLAVQLYFTIFFPFPIFSNSIFCFKIFVSFNFPQTFFPLYTLSKDKEKYYSHNQSDNILKHR